jgi:hypothetical protein
MDDLLGSFGGVEPTPAYEKRQSKLLQRSSAPVGGGSMLDDLMGGGPSAPAPGATVVKPSGGSLMDDLLGSFGGVEPTPAYEKRQSKLLQRSSAPVGGGSMLDDLMGGGPSAPAP